MAAAARHTCSPAIRPTRIPVCDLSPHHHLVARSSGACRAAACRGEAAAVFPRSTQLARPFLSMTDVAIRADRLTKRYGDTLAVDGVDLLIQQGQFFGLLGPNGAGKTSTIHMLSTLIRPTSGEAWVSGHSVHAQRLAVRRSIGVVFQEPALDRTCLSQKICASRDCSMISPARRSGDAAPSCWSCSRLSERRDHPVASLSGGMRRALDIARGVIHQPQILFLDEPTIGLDLPNRRAIWRHIAQLRAQLGITVLLTTHYLEEAADCDEVAFLSSGRIVRNGHPRALIDRARHICRRGRDQSSQGAGPGAGVAVRLGPDRRRVRAVLLQTVSPPSWLRYRPNWP